MNVSYKQTPDYIMKFMEAVFPDYANLATASFDEKHTLETATAEITRLRGERDKLADALERIANSVAMGAASKQLHARMRAIFKSIEDEARAALASLESK